MTTDGSGDEVAEYLRSIGVDARRLDRVCVKSCGFWGVWVEADSGTLSMDSGRLMFRGPRYHGAVIGTIERPQSPELAH